MAKIKKRKEKQKKDATYYVLLSVFILLCIFLIYLLFRLADAKKEYKLRKDVNFVMPIIEEKLTRLDVLIDGKKKDDIINYSFNITNYRDDSVNKKDYKYKFYVTSITDAEYTLTKEGTDENILDKKNISEYYTIKGKNKEVITYYLKIKLKEDQIKNSVVNLYIEGKKG